MKQKPKPQRNDSPNKSSLLGDWGVLDDVEDRLRDIRQAITEGADKIAAALVTAPATTPRPLAISVVAVELKPQETQMPPPIDHMPPLQLPASTVRAKLSVVDARKPDNSRVASVTWSSSDEAQIALEAIADSTVKDEAGNDVLDPADGLPLNVFSTYGNTPLDSGTATVTVKSAGMADCDILIAYSDPPVGHFAIVGVEAAEE